MVIQRQNRRNYHTVAGVNAHRVDILHAADGDGMIRPIAHDFKFDFLVALDALFDQDLMHRGQAERALAHFHQLRFVVGKAAAGSAQREGGTQHHRVTDALCRGLGLLQRIGDLGGDDRFADGLAQLLEQLTILRPLDTVRRGAQKSGLALGQNALLGQLHGKVQAGLSADTGNDRVRTLLPQDPGHILQIQRFHVDLVRDGCIGHNGGRVGVHQQNLIALLFQRKAGLRSRVVELRCLTDDDGTGADDHDFLDVRSFWHK